MSSGALKMFLHLRWQWTSFLAAGSTSGYVYLYSFYYFFFKTKMYGLFQTVFYFGYMALFSLALGELVPGSTSSNRRSYLIDCLIDHGLMIHHLPRFRIDVRNVRIRGHKRLCSQNLFNCQDWLIPAIDSMRKIKNCQPHKLPTLSNVYLGNPSASSINDGEMDPNEWGYSESDWIVVDAY